MGRSPAGRALGWTLVFIGPFGLMVILFGAFLESLRPLEGAGDSLRENSAHRMHFSVGGNGGGEGDRRTYIVVPDVFRRPGFHVLERRGDGALVHRFTRDGFFAALTAVAVLAVCTAFISIPALRGLARDRRPPETDDLPDSDARP